MTPRGFKNAWVCFSTKEWKVGGNRVVLEIGVLDIFIYFVVCYFIIIFHLIYKMVGMHCKSCLNGFRLYV